MPIAVRVARQRMRRQVHLPDRLRDVLDLSGRGLALHDDEHRLLQ